LKKSVHACSNLHFVLNNVAKDAPNSASSWFQHVPNALEDQDNINIDCE
jgi:hypothetical protein